MEIVEIQLEDRQCPGCPLTFRVSTNSKQIYHNKSCEHFALLRGELHTKSVAKLGHDSATVSVVVPLPGSGKSKHEEQQREYFRRKRELEEMQAGASAIIETEKLKMQKELLASKQPRKNTMRMQETTTPETKSDLVLQPRQENTAMTRPVALRQVSEILPQDESQGLSLIGECARHLYEQMKGLTKDSPDVEARLADPYRVTVACQCAKEIRELMKLQLEVNKEKKKV